MPTSVNGTWVIARFLDGRVLKGMTQDFRPANPSFHLFPADGSAERGVTVLVSALKALFFVRDFNGSPRHMDHGAFSAARGQGRRVRVTFRDGEVLAGFTAGYAPGKAGWFLIPADSSSNNERVFVVSAAVTQVEWPDASLATR
jgi:hypothetical protein